MQNTALKQNLQLTEVTQTTEYNEFRQDILDLLLHKNGGHVQKYIYSTSDLIKT